MREQASQRLPYAAFFGYFLGGARKSRSRVHSLRRQFRADPALAVGTTVNPSPGPRGMFFFLSLPEATISPGRETIYILRWIIAVTTTGGYHEKLMLFLIKNYGFTEKSY